MPRHQPNANTPKEFETKYPKSVSECLNDTLSESLLEPEQPPDSTLVSSNKLANRYIFEKWGIRASQRRKYRNLFSKVRQQCRQLFRQYLYEGKVEVSNDARKHTLWVYKFDDIRGNLILGFAKIPVGKRIDDSGAGS